MKVIYKFFVSILICSTMFIVGCFGTEDKPYIDVLGLATEYNVGDTIDISEAKIHYYASEDAETFDEVALEMDMVSGFSTSQVGTFSMIITYNNVTKTIAYEVKEVVNQPEQGTEDEAMSLLTSVFDNMQSYGEIKESTTTTMFGMSATSYIITTPNKQYSYQDAETMYWIVDEGGEYQYYSVSYDFFDEVMEYTKCKVQTDESNLIALEYSVSEYNNSFIPVEFVDMLKYDDKTVITYCTPSMNNMYTEIIIQDGKLVSQTGYIKEGTTKVTFGVTTYTYYETATSDIPEIPDYEWEDGGFYIKG